MKSIQYIITGMLLFIISIATAQTNGINYKAIIKDGTGNIITNDLIDIRFTIRQGIAPTYIYQETHSTTTDANGIAIANLGEGTLVNGDFKTIAWDSDSHFLITEIDIEQDGTFVALGITQFKTVPYAISAANAATKIDDLSDGTNDGSSIFLGMSAGVNDDGSNNANVGVGSGALNANTTGSGNTANGFLTLHSNTTGYDNTAKGYVALFSNTTGNDNTASGNRALASNTTGNQNTANGSETLYSNTTGNQNTANGYRALYSNTEGYNNIANGAYALYFNSTGDNSIANGYHALYNNTTGNWNTANGPNSLYSNTTGGFNTANGCWALTNNTTGYSNTAIGNSALTNNTTGSNNIGIGYSAHVPDGTADNQVRIGDTTIGYAGIQVAWTVTSDRIWKDNIRELPYGLDLVMQLKPVDYIRKNSDKKTREMGLIAQDVETVLNKTGYTDQGFLTKDDKGLMSLRYNDLIALLTKAIQEQQDIINQLNSENKTQTAEIKLLISEFAEYKEEQKIFNKRLNEIEKIINTTQL